MGNGMSDTETLDPQFPSPNIPGYSPESLTSWVFIQPMKNGDHSFVVVPYTPKERAFWARTVTAVDQELAHIADRGDGPHEPPVLRVAMERFTREPTRLLNETIGRILTDDADTFYVGFASGIIPLTREIYHRLEPQPRTRMALAIIGGSDGSKIKSTRLLSILPEDIARFGIIVGHDDVGDTMAAYAVLVEKVREMKGLGLYDETLVETLTHTFGKGYENFIDVYDRIIAHAAEAGVVFGLASSKNAVFIDRLFTYALNRIKEDPHDRWAKYSLELCIRRIDLAETEWAMGLGLDTGIRGSRIIPLLPADVLNNPILKPIIENLTRSQLRIGSTVPGLIALKKTEEGNEEMRFLYWLTYRVSEALRAYAASAETTPPLPEQS